MVEAESEKVRTTRNPVHHWGEMGSEELERFTDNLINVLSLARRHRRYNPLSGQELTTPHGRVLYEWLGKVLSYTPFGINYISEGPPVDVEIEISDVETRKSRLYATAGIYALGHNHDKSIATRGVGVVASFEDLIKVYSLRDYLPSRIRWDDVGMEIKRRTGDFENKYRRSDLPKEKWGRQVVYSQIVDEDSRLINELEGSGHTPFIHTGDVNPICPV